MSTQQNALALLKSQLPANLSALAPFAQEDDLSSGVSGGFPVMSIRGAKWRINEGGEEKPIYIPGTTDLAPSVQVVLLKANPNVSKIYFEGAYVEGSDTKPTCYSSDGIKPAADSEKPQCASCAACKHNEWGSKITPSGSKTRACGDARRMALLPAEDLGYPAILLRVPGASLTDLAAYGKQLKKAGVPYAAVVTKLSFDPVASYPKIMFQLVRPLTSEEISQVVARMGDPSIEDVIGGALPDHATPAPAPAPSADDGAPQEPAPAPAPRRARGAAPAPAPVQAPAEPPAQPSNVVAMPQAQATPAAVSDDVAKGIEDALAALAL